MSKLVKEEPESTSKYVPKISKISFLLKRRLPVKLKTKNWHGHFCLEPISFENIHKNQQNTIDILDKNTTPLIHSSLLSAILVANVQICNIPFWKCYGPQLQVCAADKYIKAYFARWESKRAPSGDSLSGWVLQWSDGTRALLYGHSLPGQPFRILCSFFNPSKFIARVAEKNKQSLQRLIMAALRLRGIERTHEEFKQLYQHIWMATIFACRQNINQQWIPIDKQQWIIERFVGTFLLEEIPSQIFKILEKYISIASKLFYCLLVIAWRMPEWITAYGRLCTDNVLDYFSQSPFYDRHSNNEVLKMQTQFNTLGDFHGHLKKMRGIEFVISAEKDPDIWVIYKQHRSSENDASVLAAYFVANESIYMAPSIHSVISSRMLNIILSLRQALASVHNLHHFSSITEYSYSAPEVPSKEMPIHNIKANQHMRKALNDAIREKLYDMTQSKDETKQELQENSSDDHFKAKLDPTSTIVKKKKKTKKSESPASPKL